MSTEAQSLLQENLQIARESGNRWGIGLGLEQLAANSQAMGDHVGTRQMLEESVAIYRDVGDPMESLTGAQFPQSICVRAI